jgi:hypothetical protein
MDHEQKAYCIKAVRHHGSHMLLNYCKGSRANKQPISAAFLCYGYMLFLSIFSPLLSENRNIWTHSVNLEKGKSIDTNKNFIDYNILSKKAGAEEISAKK